MRWSVFLRTTCFAGQSGLRMAVIKVSPLRDSPEINRRINGAT